MKSYTVDLFNVYTFETFMKCPDYLVPNCLGQHVGCALFGILYSLPIILSVVLASFGSGVPPH